MKKKKTIEGYLFNRVEKLGGKNYKHVGFEDSKKEFGNLIENFVPKVGDKKRVRLSFEILPEKLLKTKKILKSNINKKSLSKESKGPSLTLISKALKSVKHPAINSTLYNLGIISDFKLKADKLDIILAFPFPNIPIGDSLKSAVIEALKDFKVNIKIKTIIMNSEELKKFLSLEEKNWAN